MLPQMAPLPWSLIFLLLFFSYFCIILLFSYSSCFKSSSSPLFVKPSELSLIW